MNNSLLRQKILDSKRIPILPKQVQHLIKAFSNDDLEYRDLAKIIADHPVIAARLIALANSVWAAPSLPVKSLEQACINLGLSIVRSVSIGLALISPFNISACPAFDIRHFWISSKMAADAAVLLASARTNPPEQTFLQTLHTGGLLHNLGLICLADLMPKETHQALLQVKATPGLTVNQALYELLETDFCEVGGFFAETWGLPEELVIVIKHHRDTHYQGQYAEQTSLVGNAALIVSTLFSRQTTLPALSLTPPLNSSQAEQQQLFDKMQNLFLKTTELAQSLF